VQFSYSEAKSLASSDVPNLIAVVLGSDLSEKFWAAAPPLSAPVAELMVH
jgi:hypothetical protein